MIKIKNLIKKHFPFIIRSLRKLRIKAEKIVLTFKIWKDYYYDFSKFMKVSSSKGLKSRENMKAFLVKEYHAIEKGLAFAYPKPGFGKERVLGFVEVLGDYHRNYGFDSIVEISVSVLKEYLEFDEKYKKVGAGVVEKISLLISAVNGDSVLGAGGTRIVSKSFISEKTSIDFESFVKSRFSVRDFSEQKVDSSLILKAIDQARYTPSVCNRQSWKVYVIDQNNKELKSKFLRVQNGNKGFGEAIDTLLIVTGKLSSFFSYERNQVFIDGGMFSMNLLLALHAAGLGTCCLNTSYTAEKEKEFLKVMEMDPDTVPIMFIAVGHIKDSFKVAISKRKDLEEIVELCH